MNYSDGLLIKNRFGCDLDGDVVSGLSAAIMFKPTTACGSFFYIGDTNDTAWWLQIGSPASPYRLFLHLPGGQVLDTAVDFTEEVLATKTILLAYSAFPVSGQSYSAVRVWYAYGSGTTPGVMQLAFEQADWVGGGMEAPLQRMDMFRAANTYSPITAMNAWASVLPIGQMQIQMYEFSGALLPNNVNPPGKSLFYYDMTKYPCGSARDIVGGHHAWCSFIEPDDAGNPTVNTLAMNTDGSLKDLGIPDRQYDRFPSVQLGASHFPFVNSVEDRLALRAVTVADPSFPRFNERAGLEIHNGLTIDDVYMAYPSLACQIQPTAVSGMGWVDLVDLAGAKLQMYKTLGLYRLATAQAKTVLPFGANFSFLQPEVVPDGQMSPYIRGQAETDWCSDGGMYNLATVELAGVAGNKFTVASDQASFMQLWTASYPPATHGGSPCFDMADGYYYPLWDDTGRCWIGRPYNTGTVDVGEITDQMGITHTDKYVLKSLFFNASMGMCGLACPLVGSGAVYVVTIDRPTSGGYKLVSWFKLHADSDATVAFSGVADSFHVVETQLSGSFSQVRYRAADLRAGQPIPIYKASIPQIGQDPARHPRVINHGSFLGSLARSDGKALYNLSGMPTPMHVGIAIRKDYAVFWINGIEYALPHRRTGFSVNLGAADSSLWVSNLVIDQNTDMAPITDPLTTDQYKAGRWLSMLPMADFTGFSFVDAIRNLATANQPMAAVQSGNILILYDDQQREVARYKLNNSSDVLRLEKV